MTVMHNERGRCRREMCYRLPECGLRGTTWLSVLGMFCYRITGLSELQGVRALLPSAKRLIMTRETDENMRRLELLLDSMPDGGRAMLVRIFNTAVPGLGTALTELDRDKRMAKIGRALESSHATGIRPQLIQALRELDPELADRLAGPSNHRH